MTRDTSARTPGQTPASHLPDSDEFTRTLGQVTAAMRLPIECLHLAVPVSGAIGALHAFVRVFIPVADRTEEAPA